MWTPTSHWLGQCPAIRSRQAQQAVAIECLGRFDSAIRARSPFAHSQSEQISRPSAVRATHLTSPAFEHAGPWHALRGREPCRSRGAQGCQRHRRLAHSDAACEAPHVPKFFGPKIRAVWMFRRVLPQLGWCSHQVSGGHQHRVPRARHAWLPTETPSRLSVSQLSPQTLAGPRTPQESDAAQLLHGRATNAPKRPRSGACQGHLSGSVPRALAPQAAADPKSSLLLGSRRQQQQQQSRLPTCCAQLRDGRPTGGAPLRSQQLATSCWHHPSASRRETTPHGQLPARDTQA